MFAELKDTQSSNYNSVKGMEKKKKKKGWEGGA